jgi:hypothetical protein
MLPIRVGGFAAYQCPPPREKRFPLAVVQSNNRDFYTNSMNWAKWKV